MFNTLKLNLLLTIVQWSKGQEISEWIYEVVALPKIWTKKFEKFCPILLPWSIGQNFSDFFVHILGNATTSYIHSEISWPVEVWFLLWMQEVPGSNSGWVLWFCTFFVWLDVFFSPFIYSKMYVLYSHSVQCYQMTWSSPLHCHLFQRYIERNAIFEQIYLIIIVFICDVTNVKLCGKLRIEYIIGTRGRHSTMYYSILDAAS